MALEHEITEKVYECFIHIYKYPGQLEDLDIKNVFIRGGLLRGNPPDNLKKNILKARYQIKAYNSLNAIQMLIMELKRLLPSIDIFTINITEMEN